MRDQRSALDSLFQRALDFKTCSGRAEFWMAQLWFALLVLATLLVDLRSMAALAPELPAVQNFLTTWLVALFAIPQTALLVRRLHDTGRSGALAIWILIPIMGWLVLGVVALLPSKRAGNPYAAAPTAPQKRHNAFAVYMEGPTSEAAAQNVIRPRRPVVRRKRVAQVRPIHSAQTA
jgi:uncharacterized membrane protein YhaH (DUF805 family)